MQEKLPKEITLYIKNSSASELGLFTKTSSYMRSLCCQDYFNYLRKIEDFEFLESLLIELYIEFSLLIKPGAESLLHSWSLCLSSYLQEMGATLIGRLIATGLLVLISKEVNSGHEQRFLSLINLVAVNNPHFANSTLLIYAQYIGNFELAKMCKSNVDLSDLFDYQYSDISLSQAKLIISTLVEAGDLTTDYFQSISSSIITNRKKYYYTIQAILDAIPKEHDYWLNSGQFLSILIFRLKTKHYKSFKNEIINILLSFHARKMNGDTLQKYYAFFEKHGTKKDEFFIILQEVISKLSLDNGNIIEYIEKKYYSDFETDIKINKIVVQDLFYFVNQLQEESKIIEVITKLSPLRPLNITQTDWFLLLANSFRKINSETMIKKFVTDCCEWDVDFSKSMNLISCLNKLSEAIRSSLLDGIYKFKLNTFTQKVMFAICASLNSSEYIQFWLARFKKENVDTLEKDGWWFENINNLVCFECSYLLLLKLNRIPEAYEYIEKMIQIFNEHEFMCNSPLPMHIFKLIVLTMQHYPTVQISPKYWLEKLYAQACDSLLASYIGVFTLQINEPETTFRTVEIIIKKLKTADDQIAVLFWDALGGLFSKQSFEHAQVVIDLIKANFEVNLPGIKFCMDAMREEYKDSIHKK